MKIKKSWMIYSDAKTIDRARLIGYGNYSLGIRIAVSKCRLPEVPNDERPKPTTVKKETQK